MKIRLGRLRALVKEDMFNYTGKNTERRVGGGEGRMSKVGRSVSILKASVERLENAVRDNDEQAVHTYLERIKQFVKDAEASLYGHN